MTLEKGGEVMMEKSLPLIPIPIPVPSVSPSPTAVTLDNNSLSDSEKENQMDQAENTDGIFTKNKEEDMISEVEAEVDAEVEKQIEQTIASESSNPEIELSSSPSMDVDLGSSSDPMEIATSENSVPTTAAVDIDLDDCVDADTGNATAVNDTPDTPTVGLSEAAKKFAEQEAALNSYIEEAEKIKSEAEAKKKPPVVETDSSSKPKRRTIAELLKSLPGNLLNQKPMIRPTSKQVIDFDEDFKSTSDIKKKGIEELMNRYAIHTAVNKPSKEEHYKIHITKKEEDSQGIVHLQTDEAEYVKVIPDDELDEMDSPQEQAPGVKMGQVKAKLMSEIRANRAKAYEEKMKVHAMYNEELEEKDEDEEIEEILLDDEITDEEEDDDESDGERENLKKKKKKKKKSKSSENLDEEEDDDDDSCSDQKSETEDLETLLDGNPDGEKRPKKIRKRLVYLEDEADESDEGADRLSDDEDEDRLDKASKADAAFIDDRPISDDDESTDDDDGQVESKEKVGEKSKGMRDSNSDGFLFDTQNQTQTQCESQTQSENESKSNKLDSGSQLESYASQDLFSDFEKEVNSQRSTQSTPKNSHPISSFLDPKRTPVISASILSNRDGPSPLGPWSSTDLYQQNNSSIIRHPGSHISPLIPRLNSDAALEAFCQDHNSITNGNHSNSQLRKQSPSIPIEVAKLVGTQPPIPTSQSHLDDELEAICSARFPSQPIQTPLESQEFDCFGFEEDFDAELEAQSQTPNQPMTPATPMALSSSMSLAAVETPKTTTSDRAPRNTRLNFNSAMDIDVDSELPDLSPEKDKDKVKDHDDGNAVTDEGDSDDDDAIIGLGVRKQTKRKRKRLHFSDDEDDESDKNDSEDEVENEDMDVDKNSTKDSESESEDVVREGEEEESDLEIEYDEEEEEIRKPKFKPLVSRKTGMLRKEFVEGEAELSGSEEGSGDEDERGLDEFEDEVADQEEIDEDQVRDQNALVYNKLELDEDQRDIRDLENRFLENGDLHMDGKERERKFKWSNMDESKLDCYKDDDVEEEIEEDEVERQRRKEYKEKMKALNGEGSGNENDVEDLQKTIEDETSQRILGDSQFLRLGKKPSRKSLKRKSHGSSRLSNGSVNNPDEDSISENSKSKSISSITTITATTTLQLKTTVSASNILNAHSIIPDTSPCTTFQRKGSFLLRESTLTRQAEMFKISETMNMKKGKSFVFAVVTPPSEVEASKKQNQNKKRSTRGQPKKMIKTDTSSGSGQGESSSIFKWI